MTACHRTGTGAFLLPVSCLALFLQGCTPGKPATSSAGPAMPGRVLSDALPRGL